MERVAVVLPALEEMEALRPLVERLTAALDDVPYESCIILVLSTSASDADIAELRSRGVVAIRRAPTDSFGDALRSGIAQVPGEYEYVIFMDADGSHAPETIPRLLELGGSATVVVASRYVSGGSSDNGLILRAMSRCLNVTYGLVLGIRCRDVSTNFKLYRHEYLKRISLRCSDFDVVEEILFKVKKSAGREFTLVEIPDRFHARASGKTKRRLGPFVVSYIVTLMRLRFRRGD